MFEPVAIVQLARVTGGGWEDVRNGAQTAWDNIKAGYLSKAAANRGLAAGLTGGATASNNWVDHFGSKDEPGFKLGAETGIAMRTFPMMK